MPATEWRKSSYSEADDGNCVEVACTADGVAVRDSKNVSGPVLTVEVAQWRALVDRLGR